MKLEKRGKPISRATSVANKIRNFASFMGKHMNKAVGSGFNERATNSQLAAAADNTLKELDPYLDKMFGPNKEKVIEYLNKEQLKKEKELGKYIPPHTILTRLVNLYKLADEPIVYNPRKFGPFAFSLYWDTKKPQNPEENVYRPFHLPFGDVVGIQNGGPFFKDAIRLDPEFIDKVDMKKYIGSLIAELTHSVINHNKSKTFEYGIDGYDYAKLALRGYGNNLYNEKGNFENATHGGTDDTPDELRRHGFEPYLQDYVFLTNDTYNGNNAYNQLDLNTIVNNPKVKANKDNIEYMHSGLGFLHDIRTGLLQDGVSLLYDTGANAIQKIYPEAFTDKQQEQFRKDFVREPFRLYTNPIYTIRNYGLPILEAIGDAIFTSGKGAYPYDPTMKYKVRQDNTYVAPNPLYYYLPNRPVLLKKQK